MTIPQYRVYIDSSVGSGTTTIAGIQTQGSTYGVGISSSIVCQNLYVAGVSTVAGNLLVTGISTVGLGTTSLPSNSQLTFELTSNTNLRIKVRGTDGVLRSANITLA